MRFGAHDHAPAAGAITFAHTLDAVDNAGGRKIRRRNQFNQFIHRRLRIAQQMQAAVDNFIQVMRRDIGGHAHCNTRGTVD
ncbi:hypothetical protein D9M68_865490 [compost metagenome]